MKYKVVEQLWEEVGFAPSLDDKENLPLYKEWFRGYIISHFEMLYLKLRNVICVNINIFDNENLEGLKFIEKCCVVYGCKIIGIDSGEIWLTRKDYIFNKTIPSRFTTNSEVHKKRGKLLGYKDDIIDNYILILESENE